MAQQISPQYSDLFYKSRANCRRSCVSHAMHGSPVLPYAAVSGSWAQDWVFRSSAMTRPMSEHRTERKRTSVPSIKIEVGCGKLPVPRLEVYGPSSHRQTFAVTETLRPGTAVSFEGLLSFSSWIEEIE